MVNNFNYYYLKAALKRGAVSVEEPWNEADDGGAVTFATVQTVSCKITFTLM